MAETLNRAHGPLTTDAFAHANNLIFTATNKETVYISVCNTHATNAVNVDIAVDILGTGTTFRYLHRNLTLVPGGSVVVPSYVLLATDKLRARASANSNAEIYVSRIETA